MHFCQLGAGVVEVEPQYFFKLLLVGRIGMLHLNIKLRKRVKAKLITMFLANIPFDLHFSFRLFQLSC